MLKTLPVRGPLHELAEVHGEHAVPLLRRLPPELLHPVPARRESGRRRLSSGAAEESKHVKTLRFDIKRLGVVLVG